VGGEEGRARYGPPWRCLGLAFSLAVIAVAVGGSGPGHFWRYHIGLLLIFGALAFAALFVLGTLLSTVVEVVSLASRMRERRKAAEESRRGDVTGQ